MLETHLDLVHGKDGGEDERKDDRLEGSGAPDRPVFEFSQFREMLCQILCNAL